MHWRHKKQKQQQHSSECAIESNAIHATKQNSQYEERDIELLRTHVKTAHTHTHTQGRARWYTEIRDL